MPRAWASASLALLDNVTALPASRRLASAQAALATRHILILGHAPRDPSGKPGFQPRLGIACLIWALVITRERAQGEQ